MSVLGWVLLSIYVIGAILIAVVGQSMMRGEVEDDALADEKEAVAQMQAAANAAPGPTALLLAMAVVFWPALPIVAGLNSLFGPKR